MSRWYRVLATITAVVAIAFSPTINVASSLVSDKWAQEHALLIYIAVGVLAVIAVALAWMGSKYAPSGDTTVLHQPSGPVVVAHAGSNVSIQISDAAGPAPVIAPGQIVVGEIPGQPPVFVRRAEVEELGARLDRGELVTAVSTLSGGRGAGKTQIAAEYARRAVRDGVPLVAWIPADDPSRMLSELHMLAVRLAVATEEDDPEHAARLLRDALAARTAGAVLVFDNARAPGNVRPYLPSSGSTRIVLTSTSRTFESLGSELLISGFDRSQSVAYLTERTGLDDASGADAIAEELGDLPLALAQAATVITRRGLTYASYLDRVRGQPLDSILPADAGDAHPHGLAAAIRLSVDVVEEDDATGLTHTVLATVSLLSGDGVRRRVLTAATTADEAELDEVLGRLVEASLLVWSDDRGAVIMHRLVARTIRDRMAEQGELTETITEVGGLFASMGLTDDQHAWRVRKLVPESVNHVAALWDAVVQAARAKAIDQGTVRLVLPLATAAVHLTRVTANVSRAISIGEDIGTTATELLGPRDDATFNVRNELAIAYREAAQHDRAIALYDDLLSDIEQVRGPDHHTTLLAKGNLAEAYRGAGKTDQSIKLQEENFTRIEEALDSDHPDVLTARNNLAMAYQQANRLDDAIELHRRNLDDRERLFGPDNVTTLITRNNLAESIREAGGLDDAIELHDKNLTETERLLGSDHPNMLFARNNLATTYRDAGRHDEAIELHKKNLTDFEPLLGSDHPNILTVRNNLAEDYRETGDIEQAVELHRQNLNTQERLFAVDHPNALTSRNNLAQVYRSAGDRKRAIELHRQNLTLREKAYGLDDPDTLTTRAILAATYREAGQPEEAVKLYEQNLTAYERLVGPDHSDTLDTRHALANAYAAAGNFDKAIELHQQNLPLVEHALGPDHSNALVIRSDIASAHRAAGRQDEAVRLLTAVLNDAERALGSDDLVTQDIRANLERAQEDPT